MNNNKKMYLAFLLASTLLGGIGQFLFKYAFKFTSGTLVLTIFVGLVVYAVSTALYFYVLSRMHLSWAYSLSGISYIVAVILAAYVLGESVSIFRWTGVFIIAIGVLLVSMS